MSYSFSVKAATKAEAIKLANEQFDAVEVAQPVHAADMPGAKEATAAFTNLLADDDKCDTTVSVNGSVWSPPEGLRQVSININVGLGAPRVT
jgi:copper(I)-binding protein